MWVGVWGGREGSGCTELDHMLSDVNGRGMGGRGGCSAKWNGESTWRRRWCARFGGLSRSTLSACPRAPKEHAYA